MLFLHPAITRVLANSLYRRLEIGELTYEPDLSVSRLSNTREVRCAGSTHPVRGGLELESLEIDAMGHGHHTCVYLSTFSCRRLTVLNLERPIPILNDILEICPDLPSTREITLHLNRFTSYFDDFHFNDNLRTLHIELIIIVHEFAELWPNAEDQQTRAFDRFLDVARYLYPKLRLEGLRQWT